MLCPECGKEVEEGAVACGSCGAALPAGEGAGGGPVGEGASAHVGETESAAGPEDAGNPKTASLAGALAKAPRKRIAILAAAAAVVLLLVVAVARLAVCGGGPVSDLGNLVAGEPSKAADAVSSYAQGTYNGDRCFTNSAAFADAPEGEAADGGAGEALAEDDAATTEEDAEDLGDVTADAGTQAPAGTEGEAAPEAGDAAAEEKAAEEEPAGPQLAEGEWVLVLRDGQRTALTAEALAQGADPVEAVFTTVFADDAATAARVAKQAQRQLGMQHVAVYRDPAGQTYYGYFQGEGTLGSINARPLDGAGNAQAEGEGEAAAARLWKLTVIAYETEAYEGAPRVQAYLEDTQELVAGGTVDDAYRK